MNYQFTSIDLFSGPGGICTGFKWANIKPLIAVEMSDWTVETYRINHNADVLNLDAYLNNEIPNVEDYFLPNDKTLLIHGDITKVTNELIKKILNKRFNLERVDIVTGGAPCESFSMAGKRKEDDERNNLFLNLVRIAKFVDSHMILFENVKGLLSKKLNGISGQMFELICDEIETPDIESGVSFKLASRSKDKVLLNSSHYGIPQSRERVFLIGVNTKYAVQFEYPIKKHGIDGDFPLVTVGDAILDLPQIKSGEEASKYEFNINNISEPHRLDFIKKMRGISLNIPSHLSYDYNVLHNHKAVNHRQKMVERMSYIRQGEGMKHAADRIIAQGNTELRNEIFPKKLYSARNRRLKMDHPSFTVTSHCLDEMVHPTENRGLTPREVARLQSFPDWYSFQGPYVKFHSDPEQDKYEQIGDAIPPLLAYELGINIYNSLQKIYTNYSIRNNLLLKETI
ncbi:MULTISPECIES: DNA cytosine methyltransferase [Bacillaceae]|nr:MULTISPECIES: DNA cytosine methyltransferase [Bacillaceae]